MPGFSPLWTHYSPLLVDPDSSLPSSLTIPTLMVRCCYFTAPTPPTAFSSSQALTCSFVYRHNRPALRQGSPCRCHFRTVGSFIFSQPAISRAVNSSPFIFPLPP